MVLARDPNFGMVISKSTGEMIQWDKRIPFPADGDFYWVDVPPDVHKEAVKVTPEPVKADVPKTEKIKD